MILRDPSQKSSTSRPKGISTAHRFLGFTGRIGDSTLVELSCDDGIGIFQVPFTALTSYRRFQRYLLGKHGVICWQEYEENARQWYRDIYTVANAKPARIKEPRREA